MQGVASKVNHTDSRVVGDFEVNIGVAPFVVVSGAFALILIIDPRRSLTFQLLPMSPCL
jgi:hypothetical protein